MWEYFPWQNIVEVVVVEQGLQPGEAMRITYGDRTHGSPGFLTQPFDESSYTFKVYVDPLGTGQYLPLTESPSANISAGKPHKLIRQRELARPVHL